MSKEQTWALLFEQDSVVNLLGHGAHLLASVKYVEPVLDPILTVWSIGVEKLLKLSLGHIALNDEGGWPSIAEMKQSYGHNIARMDSKLRQYLRSRSRAEGTRYVQGLIYRVDSDLVWSALSKTLDIYGRAGRFHHLDVLGGGVPQEVSPGESWQLVEEQAQKSRTVSGWEQGHTSPLTLSDLDDYASAVRREIIDSLLRWWFMVSRCAQNGLLGVQGRSLGVQVNPYRASPPIHPTERFG